MTATPSGSAAGLPATTGAAGELPDFAAPGEASGGADDFDFGGLPELPAFDAGGGGWSGEIITSDGSSGGESDESEDPVDRLRRLIQEREAETVEILRSWMEEDEEPTR